MRKIVVNNIEFTYKVGQSYTEIRRNGKRLGTPSHAELIGVPQESIDRARYKKYLHITPADIASYIEKNFV